jgi:chemotaxis-related protein WspB
VLFVVFQVGEERYALAGAHVAEILPAIHWTPVAGAPRGVAGIFNYHGAPLPLIDASVLLVGDAPEGAKQPLQLHHRVLVVRSGTPEQLDPLDQLERRDAPLIGVLASRVLEIIQRDDADFHEPGVIARGAPYLGPVLTDAAGVVQRIEPEHLLPESVRAEVLGRWSGAA